MVTIRTIHLYTDSHFNARSPLKLFVLHQVPDRRKHWLRELHRSRAHQEGWRSDLDLELCHRHGHCLGNAWLFSLVSIFADLEVAVAALRVAPVAERARNLSPRVRPVLSDKLDELLIVLC